MNVMFIWEDGKVHQGVDEESDFLLCVIIVSHFNISVAV